MLLSEGQMSDYTGAALMLDALPKARALLGDRGYDADWLRQALADRGIEPCIPSKTNRKAPIPTAALLSHILADSRSEEHTSELQSLMRISYAVFCFKKKHHRLSHARRAPD